MLKQTCDRCAADNDESDNINLCPLGFIRTMTNDYIYKPMEECPKPKTKKEYARLLDSLNNANKAADNG